MVKSYSEARSCRSIFVLTVDDPECSAMPATVRYKTNRYAWKKYSHISNDDDDAQYSNFSQLSKPSCRLPRGNRNIPPRSNVLAPVRLRCTAHGHSRAQLHRTFTNLAPNVTIQELDHRLPWLLQPCFPFLSCLTNPSLMKGCRMWPGKTETCNEVVPSKKTPCFISAAVWRMPHR
jgi:hypothetical protein